MKIFSRLTRSVIDSDVTTSLNILDEIIMQGREPGQFVNDFYMVFKKSYVN